MNTSTTSLAVERVRHTLQVRRLRVQRIEPVSAHFLCVRFAGDALCDFVSASFDDHAKLMLPAQPGLPLVLPEPGPDGLALPPGAEKPAMRDYTPLRWTTNTLTVDFALHDFGPATEWARTADDVLWRRSKLRLHLPAGARQQ